MHGAQATWSAGVLVGAMTNAIRILLVDLCRNCVDQAASFSSEYLDPKVASHVVVTKAGPPASCELVGFIRDRRSSVI